MFQIKKRGTEAMRSNLHPPSPPHTKKVQSNGVKDAHQAQEKNRWTQWELQLREEQVQDARE